MKIVNIILATLTLFTFGCKTDELEQRVIGSGNISSEERVITNKAIKSVEINGGFSTSFSTRTDISKIFIIAEDNIIPYIETKEANGVITISEKDGFTLSNKKDMIVDLKSTSLNSVVINGNGKFVADALHGDNPDITINGSGIVEVSDIKDNTVDITVNGNGYVLLKGAVSTANLTLNGSGIIKILASTSILNIRINGAGTVFYAGEPVLHSIIEGSGKVEKAIN